MANPQNTQPLPYEHIAITQEQLDRLPTYVKVELARASGMIRQHKAALQALTTTCRELSRSEPSDIRNEWTMRLLTHCEYVLDPSRPLALLPN